MHKTQIGRSILLVVFAWSPMAFAADTATLSISSSAFQPQGTIPSTYTCQGKDVSPPLSWKGVMKNVQSLVLIVDDPDAPDPRAPKMTWVHWVLYNIPPEVSGLPEGVVDDNLPPKTLSGKNDWKKTGYQGPCPPIGRHRYFHKIYALDVVLPDLNAPTKTQLEQAMKGHIVGQGEIIGTYEKSN
jgi:Raf kinase inhibitor-like YbhB/YbcL family protein